MIPARLSIIKPLRDSILRRDPLPRFFFDLDETLWNCTIEYQPNITEHQVKSKTNPKIVEILKTLNQFGCPLNIVSRGGLPYLSRQFIPICFPGITFQQIEIFPTANSKLPHLIRCGVDRYEKFYYFDDEQPLINIIKPYYPNATLIHCPTGIKPHHFDIF
jgi:hypothetical protein